MGIRWLGNLSTPPPSPALNDAYYNILDKKSYIWDGDSWEQMTEDGWDGAFKSTIYKNDVNQPPNPPQDGTYDGDSEVAPTGWTIAPEPIQGGESTWVSVSRYYWNGTTWVNTIWVEPIRLSGVNGITPIKDADYFDGTAGAFISTVYRNATTAPLAPLGGSFDGDPDSEVIPTDWTDGPVTPISGEFIWASVRRYQNNPVTGVWTGSDWSTPSQLSGDRGPKPIKGVDYTDADGNYTSYVFRIEPEGTVPVTPSNGSYDGTTEVLPTAPNAWTDDPVTPQPGEVSWVSKNRYKQVGGVWSTVDWSFPAKFSGEDGYTPQIGVDYADGKDGSFTSYIFRNAASIPTEAVGGAYDGTNEVYPTNWTDNPATAPAGEKTWFAKAKYVNTGTSIAPVWERELVPGTVSNWARPVQFSGAGGTDGERGSRRYYATTSGSSWSDSIANNIITSSGDTKMEWDVVTMSNSVVGFSQTRYWSGSAWVLINEVIDGNLLVDGTIITSKIAANAIVGNKISSSTIITAGSGSNTAGMNGSTSSGYSGWRFWSGSALPGSAPFRVNSAGKVTATNVDISGKVVATSGEFHGTVYVENLVGEQAAAAILDVGSTVMTTATEYSLFKGTYAAQPKAYTIVLDFIYWGGFTTPTGVVPYDADGGSVDIKVLQNGVQRGTTWTEYTHSYTIRPPSFTIEVPANASGTYEIKGTFHQGTAGYLRLLFPAQKIVAQLLQNSSLITVTS